MMKEKIIKLREASGWTQRELGRKMNKNSGGHIAMIEAGRRPNMSLMTTCELAKAFDISLDELVKDTEYDLQDKCSPKEEPR